MRDRIKPASDLTHLTFRVSDLDAVCKNIEEAGGAVLHATRLALPGRLMWSWRTIATERASS